MDNIAVWLPVTIGNDDPIHVCMNCFKEAGLISKAYAEACAQAKRIWLGDINVTVEAVSPRPTKSD